MSVGMMYMPNFARNFQRDAVDDSDSDESPEKFVKIRKTSGSSSRRTRQRIEGKENGSDNEFEDENPMISARKQKNVKSWPEPTSRKTAAAPAPAFRPREISKSASNTGRSARNFQQNNQSTTAEASGESKAPETKWRSDSNSSSRNYALDGDEDRQSNPPRGAGAEGIKSQRGQDWATAGKTSLRDIQQRHAARFNDSNDKEEEEDGDDNEGTQRDNTGVSGSRPLPSTWNAAKRPSSSNNKKSGNNISSSEVSPRHSNKEMTDSSDGGSDNDSSSRRKHTGTGNGGADKKNNKRQKQQGAAQSATAGDDENKSSLSPDASPTNSRMARARPVSGTVSESLKNLALNGGGDDDSVLVESSSTALWAASPKKNSARNVVTARTKYAGSKPYPSGNACVPDVLTSYIKGPLTMHVQCFIRRDRASSLSNKLLPTYEMFVEGSHTPILYATKQGYNVTSNYHIFDLTRGLPGGVKALSKKSGNYMGKLRAKSLQGNGYVLVNNAPDKGELAGFVFEQLDIMAQVREGPLPRRVVVALPPIRDDGEPAPQVGKGSKGVLIPMCSPRTRDERARDMCIFQTKDPAYENGCYRLNFNGRVKIPSVKNFQLVSVTDTDDVVFQFGKFDEEKFTVDFKAPFTPFQAFALALSQFDF